MLLSYSLELYFQITVKRQTNFISEVMAIKSVLSRNKCSQIAMSVVEVFPPSYLTHSLLSRQAYLLLLQPSVFIVSLTSFQISRIKYNIYIQLLVPAFVADFQRTRQKRPNVSSLNLIYG